jgi:hypothetical protein
VEVGVGVLQRDEPILQRHEHADVVGRTRALHVRADVRSEVAAGAGVHRRLERIDTDSAHMASDSDCFSNATVSTRSWRPDAIRSLATIAVDPPTEPAVCTRKHRLADRTERIGEEELRHITALEEVGGLADDNRVDVGPRHLGDPSSAPAPAVRTDAGDRARR